MLLKYNDSSSLFYNNQEKKKLHASPNVSK